MACSINTRGTKLVVQQDKFLQQKKTMAFYIHVRNPVSPGFLERQCLHSQHQLLQITLIEPATLYRSQYTMSIRELNKFVKILSSIYKNREKEKH